MSYKVRLFAIPRANVASVELLAGEIAAALADGGESTDDELFLMATDTELAWSFAFRSPSDVRLHPGHLASVLARRPALATLTHLVHNDQAGLYWFEHRTPATRSGIQLGSVGPYLCGDVARITTDYPQRGFSNDELMALHAKAEDALTTAEFSAIADYKNAVAIGFEMLYGAKPTYLACVHAADAWRVASPGGRPTPERLAPDPMWYAALHHELPDDVYDLDSWASS